MKSSQTTGGQEYLFEYSYNRAGGLETERYPGGRLVSTCYDAAGRVKAVKNGGVGSADVYAEVLTGPDPESPATEVAGYSPLGGAQRLALQGGTMTQRWNYNLRGQTELLAMYNTPPGGAVAALMKLVLGYGDPASNNGNVVSQGVTVGTFGATQVYEYDAWNRLKRASEGMNWKQEFGYDRYGNRWLAPAGTSGVEIATGTPNGESWFAAGPNASPNNRIILPADAMDAAGNQSPMGAWRNRHDVGAERKGGTA